jgi:hypothetical protein
VSGKAQVAANAIVTKKVLNINFDTYNITVTDNHIKIGCKQYTKQEWWSFTDEEIDAMDEGKSLEWWKKWKPILIAILEIRV